MTENDSENTQAPDPRLLELLVCPLTRQPLRYDAERKLLISPTAKLGYPIRDGIPVMLPEEAIAPDGLDGNA